MMKHYFFAICAAMTLTAMSGNATDVVKLNTKQGKDMPQAVYSFLRSDAGKPYTEAQFKEAYKRSWGMKKAESNNLKYVTVMTEDFSKWTAGSEGTPDATDLTSDSTTLQSYMTTPGDWTGLMAYQAGGMCYFGEDTEHGPGYLKSCFLDLRGDQGVYRITMRARTDNPDNEDQMLQIWSLDEGASGIINAQAMAFGKEWTDLEWTLSGGREKTSIMFYGNKGKVYVDDMKVERIVYPLATPEITSCEMTDADEVTVEWGAVDGATSYRVYAYNSDTEEYVADTTVTEPKAVLKFIPMGDTYYSVYVVAKNGSDESYPESWWGQFEPGDIETPVALAATNVTDNGFTANWEKAKFASQYIVAVNQKHVATSDGEVFNLFDDDFSVFDDVDEEPVQIAQMGYCDKYFKRAGWYGDVVFGYYGMILITNMYASYGLAGRLVSPAIDYSVGGGKVKVSGTAMSYLDDAILSIALVKGKTTLSEETVDVGKTGAVIDVELDGGTDGAQLVFKITDSAEGGDMVFLDNLKVSVTMDKDEQIELPYSSTYVNTPATSLDVEIPLAGSDDASYTVKGYFSDDVQSDESNEIDVKKSDAIRSINHDALQSRVVVRGDAVVVSNPTNAEVKVYTIDGRAVAESNGMNATSSFSLPSGAYIVRVGGDTFKIAK